MLRVAWAVKLRVHDNHFLEILNFVSSLARSFLSCFVFISNLLLLLRRICENVTLA